MTKTQNTSHTEPGKKSPPQGLSHPFASLVYPNFRAYWIGMCVSLVGTWMQNIALPWIAYSLTNSPLLLGLVGVSQFTPVLFLSLFAGALLDRYPKRMVLMITQCLFLLITLILTLLSFTGTIAYWHILVLSVLMGIVNSFDMPARQSLVVHLVDKESLMNAISLNSMAFNMARVIGPTIAGIVMATFGVAACFLINAISYGAVLIGLFFVRVDEAIEKKVYKDLRASTVAIAADIQEGLAYIKQDPHIISYLLAIAVVGVFSMNNNVLLPVFVKVELLLDETYFGLVMSIFGIGSFLGALLSAVLSKRGPQRKAIFQYPFIIGFLLIGTGMTPHFSLTGLTLGVTGFFFIVFASSVNTSIQANLSPKYRGRVMSVYTLVFAGSVPFGNFFAGAVSNALGARIGFIFCGVSILLLMGIVNTLMLKSRALQTDSIH